MPFIWKSYSLFATTVPCGNISLSFWKLPSFVIRTYLKEFWVISKTFLPFCHRGILGALSIRLKLPWNLILKLLLQICSIISLLVQTSLPTHFFPTLSRKSLGATSSFLLKQLTILVLRVRGSIVNRCNAGTGNEISTYVKLAECHAH